MTPQEYGFGPLLILILVSLIFQLAAPWALCADSVVCSRSEIQAS